MMSSPQLYKEKLSYAVLYASGFVLFDGTLYQPNY